MRITIVLLLTALLALTGCVKGSGNVITREEAVSDFHKVTIEGRGGLVITQGDTEALTIEAEDNILERIEVKVEDGELKIEHKKMFLVRPTKSIIYHLQVRDLTNITVAGAVGIQTTTPLQVENLELVIAGAGDMNVHLLVDSLNIALAGAGDMTMKGEIRSMHADVAGACDVNAFDLITQHAWIEAAGATSMDITVQQTLSIDASGACDISYKGDAEIVHQQLAGSNSITRISPPAEGTQK